MSLPNALINSVPGGFLGVENRSLESGLINDIGPPLLLKLGGSVFPLRDPPVNPTMSILFGFLLNIKALNKEGIFLDDWRLCSTSSAH